MNIDENFVVFLNRENLNDVVKDVGFGFTPISDTSVAIIDRAGDFKGYFDSSVNKGFLATGDGVAAGFAAHELEHNEHGFRDILTAAFSLPGDDSKKDGAFIELSSDLIH